MVLSYYIIALFEEHSLPTECVFNLKTTSAQITYALAVPSCCWYTNTMTEGALAGSEARGWIVALSVRLASWSCLVEAAPPRGDLAGWGPWLGCMAAVALDAGLALVA